MFTADESMQLSALNSSGLNQKVLLQLDLNYRLPYLAPSMRTANFAVPGPTSSILCGLNIPQPNAVPLHENTSCTIGNSDTPIDCASRKRFLIFDHSENRTKLFVVPSFWPQNNIISPKEVAPEVVEKRGKNDWSCGDSEMVEDSEEINALLYSDSEYDNDDDDDDGENEVTSIDDKQVVEEVASCDSLPKKRKFLDDSCKKSSLVNDDVDDVVESHLRTFDDGSKKVKIHEALKILGTVVPGLESKDPVSIIEKTIVYLETMKREARSLGLT